MLLWKNVVNVVKKYDENLEKCSSCELSNYNKSDDGKKKMIIIIVVAIAVIGIIALLVLTTLDFIKALAQNDKDALKKASNTAIKRFIYCILLFFTPMIVEFLMSLFGAYGTCGVK